MSLMTYTSGEEILIRPHRGMGGLYPGVVIEESHEDALEITEHPVEQGAAVNDHAFKKPEQVTIRGGVSDAGEGSGDRPSVEFYEKLRELQAKREPFDIVTGNAPREFMGEHYLFLSDFHVPHSSIRRLLCCFFLTSGQKACANNQTKTLTYGFPSFRNH
ncbi:MAG: hypothetical protein LBB66_05170 [Desulfovibrio sp.]|jgi:hypothetical protein|nr:hypothetical protein [Desulfovibrio sp.]